MGGPAAEERQRGPQLVGREAELDELSAALGDAAEGRGRLFVLSGEPGIGKTVLADALAARARSEGTLVLWGRCWEGGGAPAYWPWVQVIRASLRAGDPAELTARLGPSAAHVARLVPELADEAPEAPAGDAEDARFALFDAVTTLLRAAAERQPLLLLLDDLHTADRSSLLLLRFLARELRDTQILVVCTYRDAEARLMPEIGTLLADLGREGRRLPLRGLTEAQVSEFVAGLAGADPPPALARAVYEATEGNPFFVDEVVRVLSTEGRLEPDAISGAHEVPIPDGIRDAIRRRLEPLSEESARVLTSAAVIGREFTLAALQAACEPERERVADVVEEAVAGGIVVERSSALGRYAFAHALIRETLYGDVAPARRVQLHLRVADALERLYAADPEPHLAELAHHYFQAASAGELGKAIDYSVRAGEHAMAQLAYEAAAGHYERALQVFGLEERADVPRRCELLLALGEAQSRGGDAVPARETFQRAAGLARKLDSPELLAHAALGYGAGLGGFEFGRVDQDLVGLLGEARRALGDGDSPLTARVLGRLAAELYFAREPEERAELSAEAVAMAERLGDPATLASALNARHLALWGPANADERLSIAGDIVALGREVGDRELELRGHLWWMSDLVELGDLEGADGEAEVHAQLAEALRDPQHLWYARLFQAMRAMLDGRFEDAERLAGEALAVGRRTRSRNAEQMFAAQLFALRWLQGRLDEIEPELARMARDYPTWMVWRIGLAFTHADEGREPEARREFERLAGPGFDAIPVDGEWLVNLCMLSEACAFLGDAARAEELLELLAPHADRNVGTGRVVACFGPVARYAGLMAGVLERWDEADAYLTQAIERDERMGARPLVARSSFDRAAVLVRRAGPGDAEAAEELLDAAGAGAQAMGMAGLERRVLALRGPADAPAAPTPEAESAAGPLLRCDGDFWTVAWRGEPFMVKDSKGLRHLAQLLSEPDTERHALELAQGAGVRASAPTKAAARDAGLEARPGGGDAGALLDPEAKAAYRERLTGLREELEEAESFNDPERAARAREEMEFVTAELAGAVGLGGRDRRASSDAERARVSVTRAIRGAVEKLGAKDPALGRHLDVTVKTGTFCSYQPEPGTPAWTVGDPA